MNNPLAHHFNRVAASYEKAASVPYTAARLLAERVDLMHLPDGIIIDLGSGTGFGAHFLRESFRSSTIIQMDISYRMLEWSKKHRKQWFKRQDFVCADALEAPLADRKARLVYSNLMLHWCEDLPGLFRRVRGLLRPGGAFVFSSCGPETLCEFQRAFAGVDNQPRVNSFPSMPQLVALLREAGFVDPVLDVDRHPLLAPGIKELMRLLQQAGSTYVKADCRSLNKHQLRQVKQAYERERRPDGLLPATFEVIYGHGFRAEDERPAASGKEAPIIWRPRRDS